MARSEFEVLIERAMSLKSDKLAASLPTVEAMTISERATLVRHAAESLDTVVERWDGIADVLVQQHRMSVVDVRKLARELKTVRSSLGAGLRLLDLNDVAGPEADAGQQAFNVVAAWLVLNQDMLGLIYSYPVADDDGLDEEEDPEAGLVSRNDFAPGPFQARRMSEADIVDIMDASGSSRVH